MTKVLEAEKGIGLKLLGGKNKVFDVTVRWQYNSEGVLVWVGTKARKH